MKLSVEGKLRLAVHLAFIASAGGVNINNAFADDDAPASSVPSSGKAVQVGGVNVTGSRIKQADLSGSSPVVTVGDEEIRLQGTVNIESLLNTLPANAASYGTTDNNGGTGTATVDLRGLGPQETLVLIDGKRLMPGDPLQTPPSPDLNFIPAALIEKIDVLSGGAAAVYGSDAVAGVVNIMMKQDFEGFRLDAQVSRTDHSDGTTYNPTLIWGSNLDGGKGNVTLFAAYEDMQAITQGKRAFSSCALDTTGSTHVCLGSYTIPTGRIIAYNRYYAGQTNYEALVDPKGTRSFVNNDNSVQFNYAPYNYLQRPTKRYNLGGFAHEDVNTHLDIYGSAMFMDDTTVEQAAPTGIFGTQVNIPCNDPLLSQQEQDYLCNYEGGPGPTGTATQIAFLKRLTELGPRIDTIDHSQYRIVVGAKGDITDGWAYDVSAQRGEVSYRHLYQGYSNTTNVKDALNSVAGPDGTAVCASGNAGCVPLDLFQINSITPAQVAYIKGFGESTATQVQQDVTGSATGDLGKYGIKSPFAVNGVGVAVGSEYRTDTLDYEPDNAIAGGTLGGLGGPSPAVKGQVSVTEAFGEIQVPILENLPFAKLFQVDAAYRWSNYNLANDEHGYKGGLKFDPIADFALRASFQRAVRAPSVSELFSPQAFGLVSATDPCSGATPGFSQAECANTGVTAKQYGNLPACSAGQCSVQTGGNPTLKAEESITRSAGFVFTPTFVRHLTGTIDYFDIRISGTISALPFASIIDSCAQTDDPAVCGDIHRNGAGRLSGDPQNGGGYVTATLTNTGLLRTKGFDGSLNYFISTRDLGWGNAGRFIFNFNATYLYNYSAEAGPGFGVYECVGRFGPTCGAPNPRYRHKLRGAYDITPIGLTLSADWRYTGGVQLDSNTSDPNLTNGKQDVIDGKIGAKQYVDLSGTYVLPTKDRNLTLRFGISNVGGQAPPTLDQTVTPAPFGNGNTFPGVYDSLGRVIFAGFTLDL